MTVINGETLVIEQVDGTPIELVVWGDEFYVRYETKDGYTVWPDPRSGLFCYADLRNGRFVSTGATIDKRPPAGLRRHLKEAPEVRKARFDARFDQLRARPPVAVHDGRALTIGPNNGLLEGRRVSDGDVLGLTILVEFSDVAASVSASDVDALLNADNYTTNGNFCSVREYFNIVSNGKLNYRNHLAGPVILPNTKKHYETTSIVPEAFQLAMDELDTAGVNLDQFDSLNEGVLDAVNFMYAGSTVYGINGNNNNPSELWPHNSRTNQTHNGFRTDFYMLSSMGRRAVDLSIGTFCHESSHLLCRFPDLYDYGNRDGDFQDSQGIGRYCLMGSGNHLNRGRTPSPVCAYLRELVGWADEEILLNGSDTHETRHGAYGQVFKFLTSDPDEYFLIENRSQVGLDQHLPSSGLAIYHCDRQGSNEYQAGTAARHYQVALLQADGRRDLEMDRRSDNEDLYGEVEGIALAHDTVPAAIQWDGSDSGLVISNISQPGDAITFDTGSGGPGGADGLVTAEKIAHLLIPDDDPGGLSSTISIAQQGKLTNISVDVDITHSFISDMTVSITSPDGKSVILHNKEGGDSDDLKKTYTSSNAALADFAGESIAGDWVLQIRDQEFLDVGRLNSWKVTIEFDPAEQIAEGQAAPDEAIPDAYSGGIESTIAIAAEGQLGSVSVQVRIAHSYIGDLHVELVSPSGQAAVLHNRTGSFNDDLRVTYDHASAPALDLLTGQPIKGDWKLRVRDLERRDVGILESWALKLHYRA